MESASVQTPGYIKLGLQSNYDGDEVQNSPLFSAESAAAATSLTQNRRATSTFGKRTRAKTFVPLFGTARKAAVPMIALSAVGWILFVLSFGVYRNRYVYMGTIFDYPELYWAWAASIIGPITYVMALLHAVMWRRASAVIGSATVLLGMIYTATLGYSLIVCGIYTYESAQFVDEEFSEYNEYPDYIGLMFAGSFIACLFWGLTLALWPWYADGTSRSSNAKSYSPRTYNEIIII